MNFQKTAQDGIGLSGGALSEEANQKARREVKSACRSLYMLSHISAVKDVSLKQWTETIKQLESVETALELSQISKGDLEEISEDILHSEKVAEFMGSIARKIDKWTLVLQASLTVGRGPATNDREELEDKEQIQLAEKAKELALRVEQACHVVNAQTQSPSAAVESAHPIEDAQEEELGQYDAILSKLLLSGTSTNPMNAVTREKWVEAEVCLQSLESYIKEHKIRAERIRNVDIGGTMMLLLKSFEFLDKQGIDRKKVDVEQAERVWGLVDKIGSGLHYLLHVDKNKSPSDTPPTTRSIFLLVSAPPAIFKFTASKDEWREKEFKKSQSRLTELVLDPTHPITADQEQRWSSVFRELERLEKLVSADVSTSNIRRTKIDDTIAAINKKVESLFQDVDQERAGEDHALMLVSWELGMRISSRFDELEI